jgi:Ner family transcriptional regulator
MSSKITNSGVPSTKQARRAWIKFELAKHGHTLASLSRATGYHYSHFQQAMVRSRPRAEEKIAAAIKLKPELIWPERYANKKPSRMPRSIHHMERAA